MPTPLLGKTSPDGCSVDIWSWSRVLWSLELVTPGYDVSGHPLITRCVLTSKVLSISGWSSNMVTRHRPVSPWVAPHLLATSPGHYHHCEGWHHDVTLALPGVTIAGLTRSLVPARTRQTAGHLTARAPVNRGRQEPDWHFGGFLQTQSSSAHPFPMSVVLTVVTAPQAQPSPLTWGQVSSVWAGAEIMIGFKTALTPQIRK